jgi:hypothetical protein
VGEAVYAIDDFPDDDLLWRIEWISGVGYNTSVPSDPLMDVCMAQLPAGETNLPSARSRSSQTKRTIRIGAAYCPAARLPVAWSGRASLTGMRARRLFPTSRAIMASNPVLSTTTKRRFRQRIVLPGVKATETAITVLGMRGLKNQTIPARLPPILQ